MSLNEAYRKTMVKTFDCEEAERNEEKIAAKLVQLETEFQDKKRKLVEEHTQAVEKRKAVQREFHKRFHEILPEVERYASIRPEPITAKWLKQQDQTDLVAFIYNKDRSINDFYSVIPNDTFEGRMRPKMTKAYLCFECQSPEKHPLRPMSTSVMDIPDDAIVINHYGAKPIWWPPHDGLFWVQYRGNHDSLADQYCSGPGCECIDCKTSYSKQ